MVTMNALTKNILMHVVHGGSSGDFSFSAIVTEATAERRLGTQTG